MAEQKETDVVIVGAGPSGLVLAIALAHYKVRSIVLEQNTEICEDPRAIAMAGDTTRILEVLGVSQTKLKEISQLMPALHFHTDSITSPPFLTVSHEPDWLEQVLPSGLVLLQPGLEKIFREMVHESDYAELRLGCEVTSIDELADRAQVEYKRQDGSRTQVVGTFIVGADGKRGYVRKGYLEAKGIEQRVGVYPYQATWIAANVQVTLPTPVSHPDFPLWEHGYEPDELWDIFWPDGFHFCRHPTMPVAAGRFGPKTDKYWRFEYELPPGFQYADPEKHLLEQMKPHLTIAGSRFSRNGMTVNHPVQFPEDCFRILRCARANFNNRVVNRWFHNQIVLIGDAAHVFPPFGAQGMASGIRDAFSLSWRFGLLLRKDLGLSAQQMKWQQEVLLESWACERRKGVDESSMATQASGRLLLGKSRMIAAAVQLVSGILDYAPSCRKWILRKQMMDSHGFLDVEGGFFLDGSKGLGRDGDGSEGGGKTAQVFMKTADDNSSIILSDRLFWRTRSSLTLLLLRQPSEQEASDIKQVLEAAKLPAAFLAEEVLELSEEETGSSMTKQSSALATTRIISSRAEDWDGQGLLSHYDACAFRRRFQAKALCVLVRPDFIIFSQAQTPAQLQKQLGLVVDILTGAIGPKGTETKSSER